MSLIKIVSSVQNISEAISSVLKIEVTVVDDRLTRIAGTGRYKQCIGEPVSKNSVFSFALCKGESFIIENPGEHAVCLRCEALKTCSERAEVCCPIKVGDRAIGAIGLIAFEEEQRSAIINDKENLIEFLNRMADLISSKLLEQENTDKIKLLARNLETVIDSVDKGIISVDHEGKVSRYNKKALQLFHINEEEILNMNIKDFIDNIKLKNLMGHSCGIKNRQFTYKKNHHHFRGVFDANPIKIDDKPFGIVFTFSNISEVLNTVNKITTGAIVTGFDNIIGESHCLKKVKAEAEKASNSTSTVLIQGESGTGKELFARAIHFHSDRCCGPFIPINCAAIPEQLLESELFGYEQGAFTGARRGGKAGKFELANNGTIFLDEIGDLPLHLQAKLLRVVQENVIEKVGGKDYIPINVRIIAATHKDLEKKAVEGEFRQDLFYRLNVIPVNIPSLRERKEDIVILVEYLLNKCNKKLGKNIKTLSSCALDILKNYQWPGNVRELENSIEYAVNMCRSDEIQVIDLPNRLKNVCKSFKEIKFEGITSIKDLEKREIEKAIKHFGSSKQAITKAAESLGIGRATLYRKIKEYNINQ